MSKMDNSKALVSPKKVCLLFTIVNTSKCEYYMDYLQSFNVNLQCVIYGKGTAPSNMVNLLGLNDSKAVIISVIRDEMSKTILNGIKEKFEKIKGGKGIAFTSPITSVIGVMVYQFLISNNNYRREEK